MATFRWFGSPDNQGDTEQNGADESPEEDRAHPSGKNSRSALLRIYFVSAKKHFITPHVGEQNGCKAKEIKQNLLDWNEPRPTVAKNAGPTMPEVIRREREERPAPSQHGLLIGKRQEKPT